jgi:hypothetical protein
MRNKLRITVTFSAFLLLMQLLPASTLEAQQEFKCNIKGETFSGDVKDAQLVMMNKEKVIQLNVVNGDKMIYLYLKASKIKDLPSTLKYIEHDDANGISPESEIIWVPDGPENPQWNAVEGKTLITQFDPVKKLISGTFEFKVEKFEYTSDENQKRPSMEITDGKFTNITYKEALAQGK